MKHEIYNFMLIICIAVFVPLYGDPSAAHSFHRLLVASKKRICTINRSLNTFMKKIRDFESQGDMIRAGSIISFLAMTGMVGIFIYRWGLFGRVHPAHEIGIQAGYKQTIQASQHDGEVFSQEEPNQKEQVEEIKEIQINDDAFYVQQLENEFGKDWAKKSKEISQNLVTSDKFPKRDQEIEDFHQKDTDQVFSRKQNSVIEQNKQKVELSTPQAKQAAIQDLLAAEIEEKDPSFIAKALNMLFKGITQEGDAWAMVLETVSPNDLTDSRTVQHILQSLQQKYIMSCNKNGIFSVRKKKTI